MQFNDVWPVLADLLGNTGEGWWLDFWYQGVVYLAFGYTVLLLFLVLLRNILPSATPRDQSIANTITWITSLSLLLIIPSLLVRLLPGFLLRLAGLPDVNTLQPLSYDNLQYLLAVVRHLTWQGTTGLAFVLVTSGHPATRQLIFRGRVQSRRGTPLVQPAVPVATPYRPLPDVQIIDELTPLPGERSPGPPEPSPLFNRMAADEITLIPSPPLPLAAWLRSLSYKGGNNKIFELTVAETNIGRQVGHITLDADFSISSNHASIYYVNDCFYLEDHSRYHSTWVNEIQVNQNERAPLRDGDTVRFGESKFQFNVMHWPDIEFTTGEKAGTVLPGQPLPILIGSGDHNHITIKDVGISDVHARLELDYQGKQFVLRPENNILPHTIQFLDGDNNEPLPLGEPPWPIRKNNQVMIGDETFSIHAIRE